MQRTYCKLVTLERSGRLREVGHYLAAARNRTANFHSISGSSAFGFPAVPTKFSHPSTTGGDRIWTKYLRLSDNRNILRYNSKVASAAKKIDLDKEASSEEEIDNLGRNGSNDVSSDGQDPFVDNTVDDRLTIFMKKQNQQIDMKYDYHHREDFSLFFPTADEIINVNFKPRKQADIDEKVDPKDPIPGKPPALQSTDELLWTAQKLDVSKLPGYYLKLSKSRLTALIVITSMGGYAMAPAAFHFSTFLMATVGTGLMSCSANSLNMFFEVPYDSQMNRTKNRVLVRGYLSPLHAVNFSIVSGLLGYSILFLGCNPLTASLGLFNLILYSCLYTPLKRYTVYNTWIGSCVGAIPPMMGWAACTGQLEPGAWLLGAMLFAWQFPHFNALSWNLRADYSRGGYRMMSVVEPEMCKRVAFRYCVVMTGLCLAAPLVEMTTWTFAADSLPLNLCLSYLGYRFYKDGDAKSSRKLFRFSLIHIPALFVLLLLSKNRSYKDKQITPKPLTE